MWHSSWHPLPPPLPIYMVRGWQRMPRRMPHVLTTKQDTAARVTGCIVQQRCLNSATSWVPRSVSVQLLEKLKQAQTERLKRSSSPTFLLMVKHKRQDPSSSKLLLKILQRLTSELTIRKDYNLLAPLR